MLGWHLRVAVFPPPASTNRFETYGFEIPKREFERMSLIEQWAIIEPERISALLASMDEQQVRDWAANWEIRSRPDQRAPLGKWRVWAIRAGRGSGKTRAGAEYIRDRVKTGQARRIALVGRTAADVRDVMLNGPSGLLNIGLETERPRYTTSTRSLRWPNGALAILYSADEPNLLRGPQHDTAWCDEVAAWQFGEEAWDNLMMGMRVGADPRVVVTTTPRPSPVWLKIQKMIDQGRAVETTASSFDNIANLDLSYFEEILKPYVGTTLGLQEIFAVLTANVEGALWRPEIVDPFRVANVPLLDRIVVGVDPAVSNVPGSNETGIVVAGRAGEHGYVFADLSIKASPERWMEQVLGAYNSYNADRIIAEVNNGGALVESLLRTTPTGRDASYKSVFAHTGKWTRAEPIAALYEQGRIHHAVVLSELESQMYTWVKEQNQASPDRMDALVWALTELFISPNRRTLHVR